MLCWVKGCGICATFWASWKAKNHTPEATWTTAIVHPLCYHHAKEQVDTWGLPFSKLRKMPYTPRALVKDLYEAT